MKYYIKILGIKIPVSGEILDRELYTRKHPFRARIMVCLASLFVILVSMKLRMKIFWAKAYMCWQCMEIWLLDKRIRCVKAKIRYNQWRLRNLYRYHLCRQTLAFLFGITLAFALIYTYIALASYLR